MDKLLLHIAKNCFDFINPFLTNQYEFQKSLNRLIKVKEANNIQYSFDVELDIIIKNTLQTEKMKVYSEESGWYLTDDSPEYICVYDPFCNSSLANRMFREAAMGITLFNSNQDWLTTVVLDYQTGIIGLANSNGVKYYQAQNLTEVIVVPKYSSTLHDAWTVVTLENISERAEIHAMANLINSVGRLIVSSGHIYWLKLALGMVDAYLDPIGGEKLYEMFAAQLAVQSGIVVTDKKGNVFDVKQLLQRFLEDESYVYYPVAANSLIHQDILKSITK